MNVELREMEPADYDAVVALWSQTPGVILQPLTDSREGIARLLERNPGLSVVALLERGIAGSLLASHDGRRGFLQHLAVAPPLRGHGVAKAMIGRCLDGLSRHQLGWVHLDVAVTNEAAGAFWEKAGWSFQSHLMRLSRKL